jgi:hypothetical protein
VNAAPITIAVATAAMSAISTAYDQFPRLAARTASIAAHTPWYAIAATNTQPIARATRRATRTGARYGTPEMARHRAAR